MRSNELKVRTLFLGAFTSSCLHKKVLQKIYFFSFLISRFLLCFFMFFCHTEGGTIKTLHNTLDCLEELATLLDCETPGMKNWLHFACKLGVPKEDCDSLKPRGNPSPTRTLMEYIVQVDPDLTVKRFIEALKRMQRTDVVNVLRKLLLGNSYFHPLKLSCVGWRTFFRGRELNFSPYFISLLSSTTCAGDLGVLIM